MNDKELLAKIENIILYDENDDRRVYFKKCLLSVLEYIEHEPNHEKPDISKESEDSFFNWMELSILMSLTDFGVKEMQAFRMFCFSENLENGQKGIADWLTRNKDGSLGGSYETARRRWNRLHPDAPYLKMPFDHSKQDHKESILVMWQEYDKVRDKESWKNC